MQDAYETLTDTQKRREYDSIDDFDDSLPENCQPKDFITVFGAAFKRQSRWSEKKPVPELGEDAAEYAAVEKFYDFWYGFKSWREFPHPDEDDPEVRCAFTPGAGTARPNKCAAVRRGCVMGMPLGAAP